MVLRGGWNPLARNDPGEDNKDGDAGGTSSNEARGTKGKKSGGLLTGDKGLPDAEEIKKQCCINKCCIIKYSIGFIGALAIISVLAVYATGNAPTLSDGYAPPEAKLGKTNASYYEGLDVPTEPPEMTQEQEDERQKYMAQSLESASDIGTLLAEGTPQNDALRWLTSQDPLHLDPQSKDPNIQHQILQRYAITTLYFSLSSGNSSALGGLLTGEHECDWGDDLFTCIEQDTSQLNNTADPSDVLDTSHIKPGGDPSKGDGNRLLRRRRLQLDNASDLIIGLTTGSNTSPIPTVSTKRRVIEGIQIENLDLTQANNSTNSTNAPAPTTTIMTLPPELGILAELKDLKLSNLTGLTGPIPVNFALLSQLKYLEISHNSITGTIPSSLDTLNALKVLDLQANNMNGTIPEWIVQFTDLRILNLNNNSFTGTVPNIFDSDLFLEELNLEFNELHGDVPPGLCQSTALAATFEEQLENLPNVTCSCCEGDPSVPLNNTTNTTSPGANAIKDPQSTIMPSLYESSVVITAASEKELGFGQQVALSEDGSRLAVLLGGMGIVRVYEKTQSYSAAPTWEPVGEDLQAYEGESLNDSNMKHYMAFSQDGYTVAISAYSLENSSNGETAGQVRVYTLSDGKWVLVGGQPVLPPESSSPSFGTSLSLDYNAHVIAIGTPSLDEEPGFVVVYRWASNTDALEDQTGSWTQVGDTLQAGTQKFGVSVALSALGDFVAIADTGSEIDSPFVAVFHFSKGQSDTETKWTPMGSNEGKLDLVTDLEGESMFGHSLAISGNSNSAPDGAPLYIVASAPFDENEKGKVMLFENDGQNDFVENRVLLEGVNEGSQAGASTSITLDGALIAIGEPGGSGQVRLMTKVDDSSEWTEEIIVQDETSGSAGSFGYSVSISGIGAALAVGVPSREETDTGRVIVYA